jgi:hypothetical protein
MLLSLATVIPKFWVSSGISCSYGILFDKYSFRDSRQCGLVKLIKIIITLSLFQAHNINLIYLF